MDLNKIISSIEDLEYLLERWDVLILECDVNLFKGDVERFEKHLFRWIENHGGGIVDFCRILTRESFNIEISNNLFEWIFDKALSLNSEDKYYLLRRVFGYYERNGYCIPEYKKEEIAKLCEGTPLTEEFKELLYGFKRNSFKFRKTTIGYFEYIKNFISGFAEIEYSMVEYRYIRCLFGSESVATMVEDKIESLLKEYEENIQKNVYGNVGTRLNDERSKTDLRIHSIEYSDKDKEFIVVLSRSRKNQVKLKIVVYLDLLDSYGENFVDLVKSFYLSNSYSYIN